MIRDYGEKQIKAPSFDMNDAEEISLKVIVIVIVYYGFSTRGY